jgi:CDP-paratose 2-epimerase
MSIPNSQKSRSNSDIYLNGHDKRPVLITGGAGFIGTNVANRFLSHGQRVLLFDNLSRRGVDNNLQWLQDTYGDLVDIEVADVRNEKALKKAVRGASKVFHFAAQVAVTTSLTSPIEDFEINARGTLNLLEALRALQTPPVLLYTSSNKVYGDLADVQMFCRDERYQPEDPELCANGFSEKRALEFHSPYGCSKGAASQYVLDYARTFNIPSVVFHMSCIYGQHQFGNEDQGWVAHFLIRSLEDAAITIYGDGKQVRDILFVEDLVDAMLLAHENINRLSAQAFNIGGGPRNTISLLELLSCIKDLRGQPTDIKFDDWRSADQQYYVSDIRKFCNATGWYPKTGVREGIKQLYDWLVQTGTAPLNEAPSERLREPGLPRHGRQSASGHKPLTHASEPRSKRLWAFTKSGD